MLELIDLVKDLNSCAGYFNVLAKEVQIIRDKPHEYLEQNMEYYYIKSQLIYFDRQAENITTILNNFKNNLIDLQVVK